MSAEERLSKVLNADKALRDARAAFLDPEERTQQLDAVGKQVEQAMGELDSIEAGARLLCLSELLMELGGADAGRMLVKVLGHPEPAVRVSAGEALTELLYDSYGEIARVLESAVEKGAPPTALAELPFILAEVGEPGGVKIVLKLLKHENADVVGAAIEALAMLGDPSVLKQLEPLRRDKRKLSANEDGEEAEELTVGELAEEAMQQLRAMRGH